MEKVKIKFSVDTGKKAKNGNPIINIELEDGRKGAAFDSSFLGLPLGQEVEIELKPAPDYEGEKRFWFSIPGQKKAGGFKKDWNLEKKRISLECAVSAINKTDKQFSSDNIIELAKKFYSYLNEK
jgi:hypothetical protein